jgi:hypothetical protein
MWRRSLLAIAFISATEADNEKTSAAALVAEVDFEPPFVKDFFAICALIIHQFQSQVQPNLIDFSPPKVLMLVDIKACKWDRETDGKAETEG